MFVPKDILMAAHDQEIIDGPMYNDQLSNLHKFSQRAVNFYTVRSIGFPSSNGWVGFMNGEQPSPNKVLTVSSQFNHMDDVPSYMKSMGYHTSITWNADFSFDKVHSYSFRGKKPKAALKSYNGEVLSSFPLWFDDLYYYYPVGEQIAQLGMDPKTLQKQRVWSSDRITSTQYVYWHRDFKRRSTQPLFAMIGTIDTHKQYTGYDDLEQYQPFANGKEFIRLTRVQR